MLGDHRLAGTHELGKGIAGMTAAAIVHAVEVAVLEDGVVERSGSLPRFVELEHGPRRPRLLKLEPHSLHGIDEVIVDEEFQVGAEVQRFHLLTMAGGTGLDRDQREQDQQADG